MSQDGELEFTIVVLPGRQSRPSQPRQPSPEPAEYDDLPPPGFEHFMEQYSDVLENNRRIEIA